MYTIGRDSVVIPEFHFGILVKWISKPVYLLTLAD